MRVQNEAPGGRRLAAIKNMKEKWILAYPMTKHGGESLRLHSGGEWRYQERYSMIGGRLTSEHDLSSHTCSLQGCNTWFRPTLFVTSLFLFLRLFLKLMPNAPSGAHMHAHTRTHERSRTHNIYACIYTFIYTRQKRHTIQAKETYYRGTVTYEHRARGQWRGESMMRRQ